MSRFELSALTPYLILSTGLIVLLLVVAFARGHRSAALIAVASLLAAGFGSLLNLDAPPGIVLQQLQVDSFARLFSLLILFSAAVTGGLSYRYLSGRRGEPEEFYILTLLATLGGMVMVAAVHFAAFILGLEILSISLYAMIAYPEERRPPLEAALKYLLLSAVASSTVLFGMALIYSETGSLSFAVLAEHGSESRSSPLLTGLILLVSGLAFKLSLVPFHLWTPDVYQGAPAPVSGFIATVSKAAVFALLLRLAVNGDSLAQPAVFLLFTVLAVASMLAGNLLALLQDNLKRILAYSSVAHMGYLLITLLAISRLPDAPFIAEAAFIYLAGYVAATLAAFGVITALAGATGDADVQQVGRYQGLFWRRPLLAACLAVALLSLMGMPLTVGFIGKFYLLATGARGTLWLLLWALIIGSAVSIYYYLKVIFVMTQRDTREVAMDAQETGMERAIMVVLAVTVVALGVYPTALINTARGLLTGFGL